jgi:hypothetical protein
MGNYIELLKLYSEVLSHQERWAEQKLGGKMIYLFQYY